MIEHLPVDLSGAFLQEGATRHRTAILHCRDDALGFDGRRTGQAYASHQRKHTRIHLLAERSDVHVDRVPLQQYDAAVRTTYGPMPTRTVQLNGPRPEYL
ncbi:hypothetical protein [Streptomyces sp. B8F3]|uniref:hypothetical protein n=1 Tax=unclassified Streptomyces TaxID=2593676 RepID=UPI00325D6D93